MYFNSISRIDMHGRESFAFPSSKETKTTPLARDIFKYPPNSTVTKLNSTFEIKQRWLYSEWAPECQFSERIRDNFPNRSDLDPQKKNPNVELIKSTFYLARGRWALWQAPREEAAWEKVEVADLKPDWISKNVEVLFPTGDHFPVAELKGIVLWKEKSESGKKYKLYEGNHRISAWLRSRTPPSLPAIMFIGKPKKCISYGNWRRSLAKIFNCCTCF